MKKLAVYTCLNIANYLLKQVRSIARFFSSVRSPIFFPSMFFLRRSRKKTSIDGSKWSDFVVVGLWVEKKCNVSGGRKGFECNAPQDVP